MSVRVNKVVFAFLIFTASHSYSAALKNFNKALCGTVEIAPTKDIDLGWLTIKTEDTKTTVNLRCFSGQKLVFGKDTYPGVDDLPAREYVEKIMCDIGVLVQGYDAKIHGRQYYNLENCDSMLDGFTTEHYLSADRKYLVLKKDSYLAEGGEYTSAHLKIYDCSGKYCESLVEEAREEVKFTNAKWISKTKFSVTIETAPNPEDDPESLKMKKKIKPIKCNFDVKAKDRRLEC